MLGDRHAAVDQNESGIALRVLVESGGDGRGELPGFARGNKPLAPPTLDGPKADYGTHEYRYEQRSQE
tara:strand:+ start:1489 stop:1692 length:204 start_codon:yes stop_codon:yes gene_type:complete